MEMGEGDDNPTPRPTLEINLNMKLLRPKIKMEPKNFSFFPPCEKNTSNQLEKLFGLQKLKKPFSPIFPVLSC